MTYAFHTPDKLCFILDLMHGGDLHYHLAQHGVFNELDMKFYAAEVILGKYMNFLKMFHIRHLFSQSGIVGFFIVIYKYKKTVSFKLTV